METNRHPVDQLAEVRAQMKALRDREAALKEQISSAMGAGNVLVGDDFTAIRKISERAGSIDAKALAADGIDVDAYRKAPIAVFTLSVEANAAAAA